jgi:predicted TIM-barrel fold metal-dependent hydrolase
VAEHPQIVQVFLPTILERQYGDPFYDPIYEAAQRNGLVVAFHHGPATKTALGYPRYFAEWHSLAAPLAAMNQMTSLVFNGTLDKFPETKFVFLEASVGWLPWAMRRMDENAREFRMEVPWLKRLPSESIRDGIRMSTQPMAEVKPRDFLKIIEEVQSDELFLFSSDYPHYDGDSPTAAFPLTMPAEVREKVFYKNAIASYPRLNGFTG